LAGGVSTIGAVARYGPPDDFDNQPTQHADYDMGGYQPPRPQPPPTVPSDPPPVPPDQFEAPGPVDEETEPRPWYRKPVALIGWALMVLILIALIIYGITELLEGGQGTSHTPSNTTTTTPTTTTTTPPTTTTTTTPPPTSSAVQPPPQQQPTQQPTQEPTHRRPHLPGDVPHLPPLPSVITIPQVPTVITLPPGLS
jgi:hypothetical protein